MVGRRNMFLHVDDGVLKWLENCLSQGKFYLFMFSSM